jgi:hypothetical protein
VVEMRGSLGPQEVAPLAVTSNAGGGSAETKIKHKNSGDLLRTCHKCDLNALIFAIFLCIFPLCF